MTDQLVEKRHFNLVWPDLARYWISVLHRLLKHFVKPLVSHISVRRLHIVPIILLDLIQILLQVCLFWLYPLRFVQSFPQHIHEGKDTNHGVAE